MTETSDKQLAITFHGRLIEHLGIQMYQKPVAAIAEMISNSWDADATQVDVLLPEGEITDVSVLVIEDNGFGMTFEECQDKYLVIGRDKRSGGAQDTTPGGRPVLGRKGIGKFAGFGIAKVIEVETTSSENGEYTHFRLDIDSLISDEPRPITERVDVLGYAAPDEAKKGAGFTKITLRGIKLRRPFDVDDFSESISRRFLLTQRVADFKVKVNGNDLPEISPDAEGIEFKFPKDYSNPTYNLEIPNGLRVDTLGWAVETLPAGQEVRWKIVFYKDTIKVQDLRGIAVYSRGKLAQTPFLFNITGGVSGQYAEQYISGQVEADFIDSFEDDVIATERQRINWEYPGLKELEEWGQRRTKDLLATWKLLRHQERVALIEDRVDGFKDRLEKLQPSEQKTIRGALSKLAEADLQDNTFVEVGGSILTAWEKGKLRELIAGISDLDSMDESALLSTLVEARVLTALSFAESAKTRLLTVAGLKERIDSQELENAVRDYIADDAWIISPDLTTFKKEASVNNLLRESADESKLDELEGFQGRIDLVLASGSRLVVLEFMRPGKSIDKDHVERFEWYIRLLREKIKANTGLTFNAEDVEGILVADKLDTRPVISQKLNSLKNEKMYAFDWATLLNKAVDDWKIYLDSVVEQSPHDPRIQELLDGTIGS